MDSLSQLAAELGRQLQTLKAQVTTAESCTGGGIAEAITRIAGSSAWFEAGFVTYSNQQKTKQLDVPQPLFDEVGAVSREVVEAMVRGAQTQSGARFAVAVSGVAGREFVMDAAATNRIGAGNLEALRTGAASLNSNSSTANSSSGNNGAVNVVVENYGTPQTYEQVPTMTAGEVRMIARDVVAKESPDVIASTIANPNSVVRKSMAANTNITRK